MMIPGFISYTFMYFMDRKLENLSVMLFTAAGILTGLTRTVTVGIALISSDYNAAVLWNRAYETSLMLFLPLIVFFLDQIISSPGKRLLSWHKWFGWIGAGLTAVFSFFIWFYPDAYVLPEPADELLSLTQMGRGPFRPLGVVSLFVLSLYILYAFAYSLYVRVKRRDVPYLTTLTFGLVFCISIIFVVYYAQITGEYPGIFPDYSFSRLLAALTLFSITAVIAMSQKSIHDARKVEKDRHLLQKSRDALARVAYYDKMTGLLNRQAMFRDIQQKYGKKRTLLFLDIDNLSYINSFQGYDAGDMVIRSVAGICRDLVTVDLYRINADVFAFFLDEDVSRSEELALELLSRIREVRLEFIGDFDLTASIGIAGRHVSNNWDSWIARTNTALDIAKQTRNCFITFNPALHEDEKRRYRIIEGMRKSLDESGFSLRYQPVVKADGRPVGAEALVRWEHPVIGIVSPEEFIPLAEATGLVSRITEFVIRQSVEDFRYDKCMCDDWRININLSGKDLINQNLGKKLDIIFSDYEKDRTFFGFEVTETELISNWELTKSNLNGLRDRGFTISLDDFGTGYSSLSYLNMLPLDKLKIDRSFIADIPGNKRNEMLLDTIIRLGKNLNLDLVVEGIEKEEQLKYLREQKCSFFQGYYFSRPLKIEEFRTWSDCQRL